MDRTGAKIKRPFQGRVLLQHQEAHLHPPTCKRRSTEDQRSMGEERKGRVGSWKENQNPVQRNRGTTNLRRPYTQPSELGAGILKETNYSENDSWKTWTLDQNRPQYATGSMMRITRVGAKARAAVDCGPGGMSSRHGSGVQVQSGRELIQSSRALLQPNGQDIQSIQALALSSQAQVQSSQALVQSSQALVQSRGLLVKGSAGLQVRVAVIKRTRLDPLPSVGPLAAPTINSRAPAVISGQGENPRSHPSPRRPSLARAGASGGPGSAGGTQEPAQGKGGPGATRGAQTGPETAAGARGCFLESTAEPTPRKTRRKIRLSGVRGRGQLQLSIQLEGDGLDIHIYQARGLLGRNCGSCDTYVKSGPQYQEKDANSCQLQVPRIQSALCHCKNVDTENPPEEASRSPLAGVDCRLQATTKYNLLGTLFLGQPPHSGNLFSWSGHPTLDLFLGPATPLWTCSWVRPPYSEGPSFLGIRPIHSGTFLSVHSQHHVGPVPDTANTLLGPVHWVRQIEQGLPSGSCFIRDHPASKGPKERLRVRGEPYVGYGVASNRVAFRLSAAETSVVHEGEDASTRSTPTSSRRHGQLQLSIQLEGDGLDIHIYQARGLLGRNCGSCDTYVKLSLIPDVDHSTRRKTPTVVNSKYPEYNQHFALNVDTENLLKRLQVTVWRRRLSTSRRSEFLGCMSFGIRSLLRSSKSISGWYYLLGAELGRTKHLKVAATETKAITPAKRAKD
ncbi:unnamed protein product [Gadus morhua 'NCC']